jgi:hypothetical protein
MAEAIAGGVFHFVDFYWLDALDCPGAGESQVDY